MKQATLKLKTRIGNVNIASSNIEVQKIILNTMFSILGGLALLYVLILGNMVFDIVQRKTLEKEMTSLSGEVSKMELSYLSVSSSVDMAMSSAMGFKETKATFATRKAFGSLKITNNEI